MTIFDLAAKITLDTGEYERGLDNAEKKTSGFGEKLKSVLATAGKVAAAGLAAAGTAVVALGKQAIGAYADYEQLVGGAELMFGDAFDFVQEKAAEAYKNVQMSQNDYLQQVNSFATGLKTALGGNAQAAAELADKIITAEADVVAATGNSQEAVQNAFNGIMKSNFTMLDNLQLGITPTKEGFQALIDKVNEWNAANGKATNYQIDNLADAQAALVDYIDMVGVAGYANEEASKTIQGSLASMRSAWDNLLVGIADDNQEIGPLLDALVKSVITAGKNMVPRVKKIISGLGTAVKEIWNEVIPELAKQFPQIQPIVDALNWVKENAEYIISALAGIAAGFVAFKVAGIITTLVGAFQSFFAVASAGQGVMAGLNAVMAANPVGLVVAGIAALVTAFITLWNTSEDFRQFWIDLWETIKNAAGVTWEAISGFFSDAWVFIKNTWIEVTQFFTDIWSSIVGFSSDAWEAIKGTWKIVSGWFDKNIVQPVKNAFSNVWNSLKKGAADALEGIKSTFATVKGWGLKILNKIWAGFKENWAFVKTWGASLINRVASGFSDAYSVVKEIGKNIVLGIWDGISGMASWLSDKVTGWAGDLVGGVADFLGIASPSKVFAEIGKYSAMGIGVGFDKEFDAVNKKIQEDMERLSQNDFNVSAGASWAYSSSFNSGHESSMNSATALNRVEATLNQILDRMGFDVVLDDGTLVGRIDKALGQAAMRKMRGNA